MTADSISQLASSGLPSLGGSYDNPNWKRSLGELKVAGDSLWTQNSSNNSSNNPSTAYVGSPAAPNALALVNPASASLLGTMHRRMPDLGRLAPSADSSSNASFQTAQRAETGFLKWEEANRRREVDILSRIVQTAEATTRKRSQELFETKMQQDWEKTQDLWTKEVVGTRTLGGSVVVAGQGGHGPALLEHSATATPLIASAFDQHTMHTSAMDRRVDPQIVRSHSEIVKQLKQKTTSQPGFNDLTAAANELRRHADTLGQKSPGSNCYSSALQIVSGILSRPNASPLEVALATLGHFSSQFESHIIGKVRGLEGQGGPTPTTAVYKSTNANTMATFVSLEVGGGLETSLWPCLFYCLRIGDAVAAKEIFQSNPTADEGDDTTAAISSLLSSLAQRQGTAGSMWEAPGPLTLPTEATRKIAEANEMAKAAERQDLHRIGFLSLLSGAGGFVTSSSMAGFNTIEDYLFGLLWKAMQCSSPVVELENMGKEIRKLGFAYFGDAVSGGWSYSLPLFASQQYRTALSYLVQAGGATGLMQAVHLGILLLSSCGAVVDNLGDAEAQSSSSGLVTSLLVEYASWLHIDPNFGPLYALEYLLWIPNKHVMMNEMVSLILRTDNFTQLTGAWSADGKREKGTLDNYFSAQEISILLKQAAERCLKDAKDRERRTAAGVLFMLSGDFRSAIIMISRFMAPDAGVHDEEKRFWYQQARQFDSLYLAQRNPVGEALQRNNDSDVVTTFRALMELFDFFTYMDLGRSAEAWAILDRLNILPKVQSDAATKEIMFQGLDSMLQNAIPSVLMTAMKSLYQEHLRTKRDKHSANSRAVSAKLSELKDWARVLLSFAGMISNLPQATIETMTRLEASMI